MLDDALVVNAVIHAYNWEEDNRTQPLSGHFSETAFKLQQTFVPRDQPEAGLSHAEFMRNWSPEDIAWATFAESDCDLAVYHAVPLTDFYYDGLSSAEKGAEFVRRWPHRMAANYGTVRPLDGPAAVEELERQSAEYGIDGLKLYPAFYKEGRTLWFRMDDEKLAYPLFEKCLELGIHNVAIHKTIPFGVHSTDPYRPGDLDEAAMMFPDINFHIVHAGWAFLEEVCFQLARFPNVYANLEAVFSLIVNVPRKFGEILGQMLYWAGPDKIMFGDGISIVHPQPGIEAFKRFSIPQDLVDNYAIPQLDDEMKAKILGGNLLRLHGVDPEERRQAIADDEFSRAKRDGLVPPWGTLRNAENGRAAGAA